MTLFLMAKNRTQETLKQILGFSWRLKIEQPAGYMVLFIAIFMDVVVSW